MKHVDMCVTNLLTSQVIVLVSYMFCISSQTYMKSEKFGRMNNACGYKHQIFSKQKSMSFTKHYNSFLFLGICISYFALGKLSVIIWSSQKNHCTNDLVSLYEYVSSGGLKKLVGQFSTEEVLAWLLHRCPQLHGYLWIYCKEVDSSRFPLANRDYLWSLRISPYCCSLTVRNFGMVGWLRRWRGDDCTWKEQSREKGRRVHQGSIANMKQSALDLPDLFRLNPYGSSSCLSSLLPSTSF